MTQCLCSFRVSVEIVASLSFKTSANVIVVIIILKRVKLKGCQDSKKSGLVLEDIGADVILKCVTEYPGIIKPVRLQKWTFKISSGQIQNYLSAVPTDCCCFSIRCNNGGMNRWTSVYSKATE